MMGVRGLSTYVSSQDRGDLFKDFKLRKVNVIIGNFSQVRICAAFISSSLVRWKQSSLCPLPLLPQGQQRLRRGLRQVREPRAGLLWKAQEVPGSLLRCHGRGLRRLGHQARHGGGQDEGAGQGGHLGHHGHTQEAGCHATSRKRQERYTF